MNQIKATPAAGSVTAGLISSLCCGGSLVFASIGLGAFWSGIGLFRYIPQALAIGALCIVAINYFYYRRAAERVSRAGGVGLTELRRGMFLSTAVGLAAMAASFVFLEWLNHAVINADRFLAHPEMHPEFAQALIPGVANINLLYALASFAALALLWALPFPQRSPGVSDATPALHWGLRGGVFAATAALIVVLAVGAMRVQGPSGHASQQQSPAHQRQH